MNGNQGERNEAVVSQASGIDEHQHDLMEIFDELTFTEKWSRVRRGLRMPFARGEHKWARLQLLRLLSPLAAVVIPILLLLLIVLFTRFDKTSDRDTVTVLLEPQKITELDKIIKIDPVEDVQPPDPVIADVRVPDGRITPPKAITAPGSPASQLSSLPGDVAQIKSPVTLRGIGCRSPGIRGRLLAGNGGNEQTEAAVLRALRYMKLHQHPDGSWGRNRTAMTSLAVLTYLAHGDTPASKEFGDTLKAGIEYILSQQKPDGRFKNSDQHEYTVPIAAYALCEAFAVTRIPKVKAAAIRSLNAVIEGQNRSGGFNYNLKPSNRDDTSYMGWCVQALKAGKMAGFVDEVPGLKSSIKQSIAGLRKNFRDSNGYGGFGYTGGGSPDSGLTAVGVLCLQFLHAANTRECRLGIKSVSRWGFAWDSPLKYGPSFLYYMYYATQARFQHGGAPWESWNRMFWPQLVRNQHVILKGDSGYVDPYGQKQEVGSWNSPSAKEHNGNDTIMDTFMCTLMLEVYYRYLPTYLKVDEPGGKPEDTDDDNLGLEFATVSVRSPGQSLFVNELTAR